MSRKSRYTARMEEALTGTDRRDRKRCFQYLARMGDPSPIAEWLGIEYIPPLLPEGLDLSEEWEQHRIHAACWIGDAYERIYEQVLLLPEEERMGAVARTQAGAGN
jgi:hypothetical protein